MIINLIYFSLQLIIIQRLINFNLIELKLIKEFYTLA